MDRNLIMAFERYRPKPQDVYHFRGNHIFLNHEFTDQDIKFAAGRIPFGEYGRPYIIPRHRVHIFLSEENPSFENGKLKTFVERAYEASNRKVIIHIPKTMSGHDQISLMMALDGIECYKLFAEKTQSFVGFRYADSGKQQFLCIAWKNIVKEN